jgi:hypothetical protein
MIEADKCKPEPVLLDVWHYLKVARPQRVGFSTPRRQDAGKTGHLFAPPGKRRFAVRISDFSEAAAVANHLVGRSAGTPPRALFENLLETFWRMHPQRTWTPGTVPKWVKS